MPRLFRLKEVGPGEKETFREFRVVDAQIKRETKGPWQRARVRFEI
jgi:hypothetical protein